MQYTEFNVGDIVVRISDVFEGMKPGDEDIVTKVTSAFLELKKYPKNHDKLNFKIKEKQTINDHYQIY